jgi:very-short-patch-repair endonuclease
MATMDLIKPLLLPLIAVAVLGVLAAAVAAKAKGKTQGTSGEAVRRKHALTDREQAMYFRLRDSFPDHVVLAQVAFSALLTAKTTSTRNTFDRKVADFVLFNKAFEVIAAIELDDASHKGKRTKDAARDNMLMKAGYTVLRFAQVPDAEDLRAAVAKMAINA